MFSKLFGKKLTTRETEHSPNEASALHTGEQLVEKPIRSIAKAISWRVTGTIDTIIVSYILTGSPKAALSIGFAELFTKMALYYLHERAWTKIKFGKDVVKPPEYEI
ncbi:MAG: DUF2061 domain-containing protein [Spirochaetota bacterium]